MNCEDCTSGKCTCGHEFGVHSSNCGIFKDAPRYTPTPDSDRAVVDEAPKQARLLTELSHEQLVARCLQLDYDKRHALEEAVELIYSHPDISFVDAKKRGIFKAFMFPEEVIVLITEPEGN